MLFLVFIMLKAITSQHFQMKLVRDTNSRGDYAFDHIHPQYPRPPNNKYDGLSQKPSPNTPRTDVNIVKGAEISKRHKGEIRPDNEIKQSKKHDLMKNTNFCSIIILFCVFFTVTMILLRKNRNYRRLLRYLNNLLLRSHRKTPPQLEEHPIYTYDMGYITELVLKGWRMRMIYNNFCVNMEFSIWIARLASQYKPKIAEKKTGLNKKKEFPKSQVPHLINKPIAYNPDAVKFKRDYTVKNTGGLSSTRELILSYNDKNEEIIIEVPMLFIEAVGEFINISYNPVRNTNLKFKPTMEIFYYHIIEEEIESK